MSESEDPIGCIKKLMSQAAFQQVSGEKLPRVAQNGNFFWQGLGQEVISKKREIVLGKVTVL